MNSCATSARLLGCTIRTSPAEWLQEKCSNISWKHVTVEFLTIGIFSVLFCRVKKRTFDRRLVSSSSAEVGVCYSASGSNFVCIYMDCLIKFYQLISCTTQQKMPKKKTLTWSLLQNLASRKEFISPSRFRSRIRMIILLKMLILKNQLISWVWFPPFSHAWSWPKQQLVIKPTIKVSMNCRIILYLMPEPFISNWTSLTSCQWSAAVTRLFDISLAWNGRLWHGIELQVTVTQKKQQDLKRNWPTKLKNFALLRSNIAIAKKHQDG